MNKMHPNFEQLKQKSHLVSFKMSWMDPHEYAVNRYRIHFWYNKKHGVILDNIYMSRDTLEGLMRDGVEW
jgi:hypothetical protein